MMFRLFFALLLLLNALPALAQDAGVPKTYGVIEAWDYDAAARRLDLRGWTVGGREASQHPELILGLGGQTYESSGQAVSWAVRPDIPAGHPATGGQAGVGFEWRVQLHRALRAGVYPVKLEVVFADGHRVVLKGATIEAPVVVVQEIKQRHWNALVVVLLGIAAIALARRRWGGGTAWSRRWLHGQRMTAVIGAMLVALVATGVTGSSMGELFKTPYGQGLLDVQGASRTVWSAQDVRGDEWGVQLPNLLAQLHHEPPFPVVNDLLGEGGQNMGVIGMTGVPVQQWATLARPATWGYFVLPMRQAMAWHWQLPFWGCLLALWWMLNVLRPTQRGLNFALSLTFCVAPYAAAWSNWPLYVTMFPAFAFVVAARLLRTGALWQGVALGAVLGWLLACWCLVLYPAWIIVVGSAMAFIGLGWCLDNRRDLRFGVAQGVGLAACALVLGALLGSWWLDTRDAIALMRSTVYPGGRGAIPGGDLGWWWHLRGYHNFESARTTGLDSNPSEASSYFILPLLILAWLALGLMRDRRVRWTLLGCAGFLGCYWVYTMLGVPVELARITLWGNMPTVRMDVGFGLVMTVLLCVGASSVRAPVSGVWRTAVLGAALLSAALVVLTLQHTPLTFVPNANSPVLIAAMAVAAAFICGWALFGRVGSAVALMTLVSLLVTLEFNPLRIAPAKIELAAGQRAFVSDAKGQLQRTLVLNGDAIGAMVFAAVGIPIADGVFYYPHRVMWDRMKLPTDDWFKVNRYQHLGFYLNNEVETPLGYDIVLASLDQVHVQVNPRRFDFACTGAARVAAPVQWTQALTGNPGLTFQGAYQNVVWFAVQPSCPKAPASGA